TGSQTALLEYRSSTATLTAASSATRASRVRDLRIPAFSPLWRFVFSLWLIITFFYAAVVVFSRGSAQEDRLARLGLRRCSDLPCLHGVIPGQTSWTDALAAFNGQAALTDDPLFDKITLFRSSNGLSLEAILIELPPDHPVPLGEIIAYYGTPSCVFIYGQG